jgi:hypothetical protein
MVKNRFWVQRFWVEGSGKWEVGMRKGEILKGEVGMRNAEKLKAGSRKNRR